MDVSQFNSPIVYFTIIISVLYTLTIYFVKKYLDNNEYRLKQIDEKLDTIDDMKIRQAHIEANLTWLRQSHDKNHK
jgi:hypothetical protein